MRAVGIEVEGAGLLPELQVVATPLAAAVTRPAEPEAAPRFARWSRVLERLQFANAPSAGFGGWRI